MATVTVTTPITAQPAPRARRRDLSGYFGYLLIAPPVLIMLLLIFYPAALAIIDTVFIPDANTGQVSFTLQNYTGFFRDQILVANLSFTLTQTVAIVALLFLVGFPLALYLRF